MNTPPLRTTAVVPSNSRMLSSVMRSLLLSSVIIVFLIESIVVKGMGNPEFTKAEVLPNGDVVLSVAQATKG